MSNFVSDSKSKTPVVNSFRGSNNFNVTDSNSKGQNTYLVNALVSEVRPGGDVILATNHGLIRAGSKYDVQVGDKVTVRVTNSDEGETKASITSVAGYNQENSEIQTTASSILMKYLAGLISGNKAQDDPGNVISAKFSYMAPNRNFLKYGHINPGDSIRVQIIPMNSAKHEADIIAGAVISNDHGILSINSSLGILNLEAQSNFLPSQKILLRIMDIPQPEQITKVGGSISHLMQYITNNIDILKQVLLENSNIWESESYNKLMQLVTTQHDGATLAKIFRQNRNIPASDIERWIEEEIVEPFEASSKGNKLTVLSRNMADIAAMLEQMNVLPKEIWHSLPIPIAGTNHNAYIKVKKEENLLHFSVDIDHPEFGKVILQGVVEIRLQNNHVSRMSCSIKHTDRLPQGLIDSIASIFAEHQNVVGMDGALDFMKLEEV